MKMKLLISAALAMSAIHGYALNPIIQTIYTADPAPVVVNGVCYLYTDHDEDGSAVSGFNMKDWRCFTSTDMVNWTDQGVVASLYNFQWAGFSDGSGFTNGAWALQCIERDGKWYMYCPLQSRGIGVLVADNPFGPFTDPIGKPLIGGQYDSIDPTVFVDTNDQAYLCWGNPRNWYVKLNKDMISYDTSIGNQGLVVQDMTVAAFGVRTPADTNRPTSYEEGPWLYQRNALYYLIFAGGPLSEHIGYSTGPSPTGPWTYGGVVMAPANLSFTIHPGVVDFNGKTYLFYHNGALPGGDNFHRSVCVDEMTFNPDGSIPMVQPTTGGPAAVATLNPYQRVEAETIAWESGIKTTNSTGAGVYVTGIHDGSYIKVCNVDFTSQGGAKFRARVAGTTDGGAIELRLDNTNGPIIGTLNVKSTGGADKWETQSCDVSGATGVHNLVLKFTGGNQPQFNFDWWSFSALAVLPGSIIGSSGSWSNSGNTITNAFDGNTNTFYDAVNGTNDWAGLDLGSGAAAIVTQLKYCPRAGWAGRMVGGQFQGANVADFSSGVVTLFTVASTPPEGTMTVQAVTNATSFHYLRYIGPANAFCDVAEVEFDGFYAVAPSVATNLSATASNAAVILSWNGSAGADSYLVKRSTTSGSGYVTIASGVNWPSYLDTGVVSGTTYYYVVAATNVYGVSPDSTEASATPAEMFGWWKFDATSGTTAADSGSGGNPGTLQSGATWVAGVISNAVHLDGTANGYASLPSGLVSALNDFTISTWVKVDANATWARVFDFGSGTGTYMFLAPSSGGAFVRYAITTSGGGGEQQLNRAGNLSTGVWHHLAVTLSGSTGVLYVDGVPANTNLSMTLKPSSLGSTTQNYIGKSQWPDPNLTGSVDDFRIYSRALNATEVAALASPVPPAPAGLAAVAGNAQVVLNWNAASTATGYKIKRLLTSGSGYANIATNSGLAYTNTGLSNGTLYYFVVSATNSFGESTNSTQVGARPTSAASIAISVISAPGQLQFSWPADHTGWQLQAQTNTLTSGLGTNWVNVASSTQTNQMTVPLNSTNGSVFFRLVRPY